MYKKGKSYEEIEIGEKASFTKTITETDIYLFAGISGDFNPLHVNEEYAKTTIFGTRIAHGGLAASLLAPVLGMKLPGLGTVALETVTKFRKPVYPGDTVTCAVEVKNKIEKMKMIQMKILWTNQKGETIGKGECKVLPPGFSPETISYD
ncbi:MaoC family dehydratase [Leptospira noguchii]|uniref:MaoC family dehydratase n=1 Tax=Leptospira noguchii TaxID=28182 RepID=UPI000774439C|nr:MaoC family dehydratase [Leptospira noguchii]UOG60342.1 MaoC family dehydratase [Leptospira noguchii]